MYLVTQVGRIVVAAVLVFVLGFAYATVSPLPTSASGQCPPLFCQERPTYTPVSCRGDLCDTREVICCREHLELVADGPS